MEEMLSDGMLEEAEEMTFWHDGASHFDSKHALALYCYRIPQYWNLSTRKRRGVAHHLKGDIDRFFRWMSGVVADEKRRRVLNSVDVALQIFREAAARSWDDCIAATSWIDYLPQTSHADLDLQIPAVVGRTLPINLKGAHGWYFRINDQRRTQAQGGKLLGRGPNALLLTGIDAWAEQIGGAGLIGSKTRRIQLTALPTIPVVLPGPKPAPPPTPPPPGESPSESSSSSSSSDSEDAASDTSSEPDSEAEEYASESEAEAAPLVATPDVDVCHSSSQLPQSQKQWLGWRTSYRIKAPEVTDAKKLMKCLERRQKKYTQLSAKLPASWRAARPRPDEMEERRARKTQALRRRQQEEDAREGRPIKHRKK